ncbi:heterokaryon incompatibility protein-domain-containing protein [Leptodontidium sp. MPI-SDFR-AT-0119]|nr:heterokaryon incompatibility protein-domain-containing protein [Leptodontidium sp. MPI-SDFR-AT-0119]
MTFSPTKSLYSPLSPNKIRLLILHPGKGDDAIKCSLKTALLNIKTLTDREPWSRNTFEIQVRKRSGSTIEKLQERYRGLNQPRYETLSYCWGPEGDYRSINIDGHFVPVRRNLWWALYHLRHRVRGVKRTLWVDALCINQNDIPERSAQVSIMGSIYATASGVLIWAGEEANGSTEAMKAISAVPSQSRYLDPETGLNPMYNPLYIRHEEEFIALCTRPYWGRLWVIQEVCLAARLKIHCGPASVSWDAFRKFWDAFGGLIAEENTADYVPVLLQELIKLSQGGRQSLEEIICSSRHFECADPRDRLYGILGLLDIQEPKLNKLDPRPIPKFPAVDYSKTSGQLYADLMRWSLASGEVSPANTLIFSQNTQRALEFPFPGTPSTKYAELEGKDPEEAFPILFAHENCTEIVSAVGPLECVEYSHAERAFRWTDAPATEFPTRSLDMNFLEPENFRYMLETQQDDGVDLDVIDLDLQKKTDLEMLGVFRRFQTGMGWWYVGPPDVREGDVIDGRSMLLLRHYNLGSEVTVVGKVVKYDPRPLKMKNINADGELDWTKFVPVENEPRQIFEPFAGDLQAFLTLSEIQVVTR